MSRYARYLFLISLLALPVRGYAWDYLATTGPNSDGIRSRLYYDPVSLHFDPISRIVSVIVMFDAESTYRNGSRSAWVDYEIDCVRGTTRVVEQWNYTGERLSGDYREVLRRGNGPTEWKPSPPTSAVWYMWQRLCR